MRIDDKIRDEKLQYESNKEAAKISALSSGRIDEYEYLTGKEILPSDQSRILKQAKFTYSPLGKTLEKQRKLIEKQAKQSQPFEVLKPEENKEDIKSIEGLFPKKMRANEINILVK